MSDEPVESSRVEPVDIANSLLTVLAKLYVFCRHDDVERRAAGKLTNAQYSVLRTVAEWGSVRVSELAQAAGVTLPTMSVTVSRLTRRGLVCRPSPTADKRNSRVALTGYGARVFDAATQARHASLQTRVLRLSIEDQHALSNAVDVLRRMTDGQASTAGDVGTELAEPTGSEML